jgi:1-acyl-sn-glycerol-3-phosphate acyltransferase
MISYIVSMCIALPLTLAPIWILSKTQLVHKTQTEIWAHDVGQACARWLLTIMPFCEITVVTDHQESGDEPTIWVCNHTSMLDTFILLASDFYLRGPNKRPIKAIYVSIIISL